MAVRVRSDRRYQFALPPERLWERMSVVDEYRTWWPWLHRLEAAEFVTGARWAGTIEPPLPYASAVRPPPGRGRGTHLAVARLEGDIVGHARLDVTQTGDGAQARLVSDLAPGNRMLRAVAGLAWLVARYGHDWVLDTRARQFRQHGLPSSRRRGRRPAPASVGQTTLRSTSTLPRVALE